MISLEKLLAKIEEHGWQWTMKSPDNKDARYGVALFNPLPYGHFYADSPAEAAAQALLWILKEES